MQLRMRELCRPATVNCCHITRAVQGRILPFHRGISLMAKVLFLSYVTNILCISFIKSY